MSTPSLMRLPPTVDVTIEVAQWSFVKRKGNGRIDFISPFPSPFGGYGSIEDIPAEDGDPLDAVIVGRRCAYGSRVRGHVRGYIAFRDNGETDNKVICVASPSAELSDTDKALCVGFFKFYALAKTMLNGLRGKRGVTAYEGFVEC